MNPYTSETYRELNRQAGKREFFQELWDEIEAEGPLTLEKLVSLTKRLKLFAFLDQEIERIKNKSHV